MKNAYLILRSVRQLRTRRRSPRFGYIAASSIVLAILSAAFLNWHPAAAPGSRFESADRIVQATVERVVDGDTLVLSGVESPSGVPRMRLWGFDAPERGDCWSAAATTRLTELVLGQTLVCRMVDIDRYGRLVGQCLVEGSDLGTVLVGEGLAMDLERFSSGAYRQAEIGARERGVGIWSGECLP